MRTPSRALGLVAAGTWPTKTWPTAHAARFARALTEREVEVLVPAGPGEDHVTEVVRRHAPLALVLPPCDVAALVAVIARLGGVVGTDSGPRHLAAALGVPTFAWFGPTNPDNWTPARRRAPRVVDVAAVSRLQPHRVPALELHAEPRPQSIAAGEGGRPLRPVMSRLPISGPAARA